MHGIISSFTGRRIEVERKRPIQARSVPISPPADKPYRRLKTIEMEVGEWIGIPRNPRQRNEVVRIEKSRVAHLLTPDEIHRVVAMAILPDGSRLKVDGHTRTACWKMGLVEPPKTLLVDVWECADIDAAQQLYDRFDNTFAAETGTDRVTGAYLQAGISPKSPMLKDGEISTAARELHHYLFRTSPSKETKNAVINESIIRFAKEIELLDTVTPTRSRFPGGVVMGALITLANEPATALDFWTDYAADAGHKSNGRMDAVQALSERVSSDKRRGSRASNIQTMSAAVAAVGGYATGATYTVRHGITAKSKDMMRRYADAALAKKGVR